MTKQLMLPGDVRGTLRPQRDMLDTDLLSHRCARDPVRPAWQGLSSGVRVYARLKRGVRPVTAQELSMINPRTVELWNGKTWVRLLSVTRTGRSGAELQLTLRSGESFSCAIGQRWLTTRGVIPASEIVVGDRLQRALLPEPEHPLSPTHLPDDHIGWFVGLYLAEGSRGTKGTIDIASHADEKDRFARMEIVAQQYGARCRVHYGTGKKACARINSKILSGVVDTYLVGVNAKTKHLRRVCWCRSNHFLSALIHGYLGGDGHWESRTSRWRLGFTRNYSLASDVRTLCARLGYRLTLNPASVRLGDRLFPTFRGEIRCRPSCHRNTKDRGEVLSVVKSKHRAFYEITTLEDPTPFTLATGLLAHSTVPDTTRMLSASVCPESSGVLSELEVKRAVARYVSGQSTDAEQN